MLNLEATIAEPPPREAVGLWSSTDATSLSSLHQLAPYIGKLKPAIARYLVDEYTAPGDLVADPFCGSGTIPLEAAIAGRSVFASDDNPYAFVLTNAKLMHPASAEEAIESLGEVIARAALRKVDLRSVPGWVKAFFHPETLRDAIQLADECLESSNWFILACLLGILHHQRPGFLSYPSSHLVPYLRERKFPRSHFPELYAQREVGPRLVAKIERTYKHFNKLPSLKAKVVQRSLNEVRLPASVNSIITSPPYMNALDYRRDNRLRLWFIDRTTTNYSPEPTDRASNLRAMIARLVHHVDRSLANRGHLVLVVGETVVRKRATSHPSALFCQAISSRSNMKLVDALRDDIPDIRRSRRDCRGTKSEHILVFQKSG